MKSFVTVEQKKCMVCAKDFDTNALLLDRRMSPRFEHKTLTGWGLCPEHQAKYDEGYIALVTADESKSTVRPNGRMDPEGAYRTGTIVHIRFALFERMFNVPAKDGEGRYHPVMFCDQGVVEHLQKVSAQAEEGR